MRNEIFSFSLTQGLPFSPAKSSSQSEGNQLYMEEQEKGTISYRVWLITAPSTHFSVHRCAQVAVCQLRQDLSVSSASAHLPKIVTFEKNEQFWFFRSHVH